MGQDLRQIALGELIFLSGVGLYHMFLLFSIWYIRAPKDPFGFDQFCPLCIFNAIWATGLGLGLLVLLVGAWKMIVNGTLGGIQEQSLTVLITGGVIIAIGILLFILPMITGIPTLMPMMFDVYLINPLYLASSVFSALQIILGVTIIIITFPHYLKTVQTASKQQKKRVESFRELLKDNNN